MNAPLAIVGTFVPYDFAKLAYAAALKTTPQDTAEYNRSAIAVFEADGNDRPYSDLRDGATYDVPAPKFIPALRAKLFDAAARASSGNVPYFIVRDYGDGANVVYSCTRHCDSFGYTHAVGMVCPDGMTHAFHTATPDELKTVVYFASLYADTELYWKDALDHGMIAQRDVDVVSNSNELTILDDDGYPSEVWTYDGECLPRWLLKGELDTVILSRHMPGYLTGREYTRILK